MNNLSHISDYLNRNAKNVPNKTAIVDESRSLTWQELYRLVLPASQALRQMFPGDEQALIGLLLPNSWEYVVAYLAIIEAGHIAVPIDVIYKPLEIDAIIKQMALPLVMADEPNIERAGKRAKVVKLADLKPNEAQLKPLRLLAGDQIATIFFTSGTTGRPKAAPYTHANHMWNIKVCSQVWGWNSDDSLLILLRLSHWYGSVMGLSGILYHGNTMYIQDRFSAEATLQLLASGKISLFTHAPLVYGKLIEAGQSGGYDLSAVRLFISGSGPLPPPVWQAFKDTFGAEILEVYGSSESGRIASNLLAERIPGSPGRPLPEVDVKLVDGEVCIKSPGVFPGYYRNSEATRAATTPDGYWRTGDIGELDNGRLILKGRHQEIIRKRGYTVSPRDIEWALHASPAIREAAVVGHSVDGQDDTITYFLVTDAADAEIDKFCKQNLPSVWRPDKIMRLEELPRTSRGKVNMSALRTMVN